MDVDVAIVGNGPTALLALRAMADLGLEAVAIGPRIERREDPRTTALLPSTVEALAGLGVDVAPSATPLGALVIETTGPFGTVRERFSAPEVGQAYLALNVTMPDLMARLAPEEPADGLIGTEATALVEEPGRATVETADGRRITARLVIAADGLASPMRRAAGIVLDTKPLGRSAFCTPVDLAEAHEGVCIERYDDLGSLTVIPVGERSGSLITIQPTRRIEALAAASPAVVERGLFARQPAYGAMRLAGPAAVFPLSIGWAAEPARGRVVAVGEAAHVVPPIGAQGWNMAVGDILALRDTLRQALASGSDIASESVLAGYAKRRRPDLFGRVSAVGLLAGVATLPTEPRRWARQLGLSLLSGLPEAKRFLMRRGLS